MTLGSLAAAARLSRSWAAKIMCSIASTGCQLPEFIYLPFIMRLRLSLPLADIDIPRIPSLVLDWVSPLRLQHPMFRVHSGPEAIRFPGHLPTVDDSIQHSNDIRASSEDPQFNETSVWLAWQGFGSATRLEPLLEAQPQFQYVTFTALHSVNSIPHT